MPFGGSHWLYLVILLILALIIFGPGKLPEVGSGLGRAIREFKKATTETTDTFRNAVHDPAATTPGQAPGNQQSQLVGNVNPAIGPVPVETPVAPAVPVAPAQVPVAVPVQVPAASSEERRPL